METLIKSDDTRNVPDTDTSKKTLSELLESDSENYKLLAQHYIQQIVIGLLETQWYIFHADKNPYSENLPTL